MSRKPTASPADSWHSMLSAKPIRNSAAKAVEKRENCVTLHVKKEKPRYLVPLLSWIVPFNPQRRVSLDPIGTRVWRWCDGERTVEDVVDRFADAYKLTFHEARAAVTAYLKMLIQRGVLAIIVQESS